MMFDGMTWNGVGRDDLDRAGMICVGMGLEGITWDVMRWFGYSWYDIWDGMMGYI